MSRRGLFKAIWLIALVLAALSPPPGHAQDTETSIGAAVKKDLTGVLLADAALKAMTGGTPISDVVLQGRATQPDGEATDTGLARLAALSPRHSRQEFQMGNGPFSLIRSTDTGVPSGAWSGADGEARPIPLHNTWVPADWFYPVFTLAEALSDPEIAVGYLGRETRDGLIFEHLRLARVLSGQSVSATPTAASLIEKLSTVDVYLDPASLLPVALAYNLHPDDDAGMDIPGEVRFGKYQSVGGLQVPTVIQQLLQGQVILELAIDSAAANTGLTEFDFAL